jgi:hypothetical protein
MSSAYPDLPRLMVDLPGIPRGALYALGQAVMMVHEFNTDALTNPEIGVNSPAWLVAQPVGGGNEYKLMIPPFEHTTTTMAGVAMQLVVEHPDVFKGHPVSEPYCGFEWIVIVNDANMFMRTLPLDIATMTPEQAVQDQEAVYRSIPTGRIADLPESVEVIVATYMDKDGVRHAMFPYGRDDDGAPLYRDEPSNPPDPLTWEMAMTTNVPQCFAPLFGVVAMTDSEPHRAAARIVRDEFARMKAGNRAQRRHPKGNK